MEMCLIEWQPENGSTIPSSERNAARAMFAEVDLHGMKTGPLSTAGSILPTRIYAAPEENPAWRR